MLLQIVESATSRPSPAPDSNWCLLLEKDPSGVWRDREKTWNAERVPLRSLSGACFLSSPLPVFSKDESERIKCRLYHQSMKFSDYGVRGA